MENENQNNKDEEKLEEKQEETTETTQPQVVAEAVKAAERIEAANKQMAELIARQEKLQAFAALGGKSEIAPEEKKEITPKEYAEAASKGIILR